MIKTLKRRIDTWMFAKKGAQFCDYFNFLNRFYWKYPITLSWDAQNQKILVRDVGAQVFIARPRRARRYEHGINAKLASLAREYMLGRIDFHDGDCVLDCGANVGEVGMCLERINGNLDIVSIEPEEDEAACCDLNVYGGQKKTLRKALWSEEGELTLFSKNQSGDSSLFETRGYESSTKIATTTLSKLIEERDIAKVKLLKLEAEGAEPEILAGAEKHLSRLEYVSADLGPERGIDQESTAAAAINFLLSRNFRLIDVYCDRLTYLFKNTAIDGRDGKWTTASQTVETNSGATAAVQPSSARRIAETIVIVIFLGVIICRSRASSFRPKVRSLSRRIGGRPRYRPSGWAAPAGAIRS